MQLFGSAHLWLPFATKRTSHVYAVQRPEVDPRRPLSSTAHALFTPCRKLNVLFTHCRELKPDVDVLI